MVEPIIPGTEKILPGAAYYAGLMALDGVKNMFVTPPEIGMVTIFVIADKHTVVR
jgi:hypothetical protein